MRAGLSRQCRRWKTAHDFDEHAGAVPPTNTFARVLALRLDQQDYGISVHTYSSYPFKHRRRDDQLND